MEKLVLEPSTNTHTLSANKIESKKIDNSTVMVRVEGIGIVSHGEHGTVKTDSPNLIKYNQQELNPVTKKMQKVFD